MYTTQSLSLFRSWLIDTDKDDLGFQIIVDLHGGDPTNPRANSEFDEIKENVMREVSVMKFSCSHRILSIFQRQSPDRSYAMAWRKYKRRILLAMSSQAFAQLVRVMSILLI